MSRHVPSDWQSQASSRHLARNQQTVHGLTVCASTGPEDGGQGPVLRPHLLLPRPGPGPVDQSHITMSCRRLTSRGLCRKPTKGSGQSGASAAAAGEPWGLPLSPSSSSSGVTWQRQPRLTPSRGACLQNSRSGAPASCPRRGAGTVPGQEAPGASFSTLSEALTGSAGLLRRFTALKAAAFSLGQFSPSEILKL